MCARTVKEAEVNKHWLDIARVGLPLQEGTSPPPVGPRHTLFTERPADPAFPFPLPARDRPQCNYFPGIDDTCVYMKDQFRGVHAGRGLESADAGGVTARPARPRLLPAPRAALAQDEATTATRRSAPGGRRASRRRRLQRQDVLSARPGQAQGDPAEWLLRVSSRAEADDALAAEGRQPRGHTAAQWQ